MNKSTYPKKALRSMRSTHRKQSRKELNTVCISRPVLNREFQKADQSRLPRASANLKKRSQNLEKSQRDLFQPENSSWGELECLTVSMDSLGQYWIAVKKTGKPFIRKPFAQPEFCYEVSSELEDTFDILQVVEQQPPETIEQIEEMVEFYLDRERVLLGDQLRVSFDSDTLSYP